MSGRHNYTPPRITCPWCLKPVAPGGPRMRVHQSETILFSGNTLAHLHVDCGDALLDFLEERGHALQETAA